MVRRGRPGLMGTMARTAVIAGTATAVSKGVSGAMTPDAPKQAAPPPQPYVDPAAQQAAAAAQQQAMVDAAAAQAVAQVQAQEAAAQDAAAAAAKAADDEKFTKLAKLGELHKAGVLSDEEFAAEKAKLLA